MSLKSMAVTHLRVCTSILILSAVSILNFPDVRNMFSQLRLIYRSPFVVGFWNQEQPADESQIC